MHFSAYPHGCKATIFLHAQPYRSNNRPPPQPPSQPRHLLILSVSLVVSLRKKVRQTA
jgi:hypothetical protein